MADDETSRGATIRTRLAQLLLVLLLLALFGLMAYGLWRYRSGVGAVAAVVAAASILPRPIPPPTGSAPPSTRRAALPPTSQPSAAVLPASIKFLSIADGTMLASMQKQYAESVRLDEIKLAEHLAELPSATSPSTSLLYLTDSDGKIVVLDPGIDQTLIDKIRMGGGRFSVNGRDWNQGKTYRSMPSPPPIVKFDEQLRTLLRDVEVPLVGVPAQDLTSPKLRTVLRALRLANQTLGNWAFAEFRNVEDYPYTVEKGKNDVADIDIHVKPGGQEATIHYALTHVNFRGVMYPGKDLTYSVCPKTSVSRLSVVVALVGDSLNVLSADCMLYAEPIPETIQEPLRIKRSTAPPTLVAERRSIAVEQPTTVQAEPQPTDLVTTTQSTAIPAQSIATQPVIQPQQSVAEVAVVDRPTGENKWEAWLKARRPEELKMLAQASGEAFKAEADKQQQQQTEDKPTVVNINISK